jgi:hypothetical protein
MTVEEIRRELKPVKPISRERLYFYFRKFKIKPLSGKIRLKPAQYPADTPLRIKLKLGLNGIVTVKHKPLCKATPASKRLLKSIIPKGYVVLPKKLRAY